MTKRRDPTAPLPPQHQNRDYKAEAERKRAEGKSLGGREPKPLDYGMLEQLCGIFCTGEECASMLKMSYQTLNLRLKADYAKALEEELAKATAEGREPDPEALHGRYDGFEDCFDKNSAMGRVSLRRSQFLQATDAKRPNTTMQIWMGKNHLGQTDRLDMSSKDGSMSPQPVAPSVDLSKLDTREFDALGQLLAKARAQGATVVPEKPEQQH